MTETFKYLYFKFLSSRNVWIMIRVGLLECPEQGQGLDWVNIPYNLGYSGIAFMALCFQHLPGKKKNQQKNPQKQKNHKKPLKLPKNLKTPTKPQVHSKLTTGIFQIM